MQFRMLFFLDENDEVAGGASSFPCIPPSTYAELHAFLYACGDVDGHCLFAVYAAFAFTDRTFGRDGGAFAVAGRACGDRLHLAQEGAGDLADLAAAAAGGAGLYAALVLGAAAAAGITGDVFFNL